jgi:hypothetical protein
MKYRESSKYLTKYISNIYKNNYLESSVKLNSIFYTNQ